MTALDEAQTKKKEIEAALDATLNQFQEDTGLTVQGIEVRKIELTALAESGPSFIYQTKVEITI